MKRFGNISLFKIDDFTYHIEASKYTYKQVDIPWLIFYMSRKTAKKERKELYNRDRSESMFKLFNKVNVSGMRNIIKEFKKYFDSFNIGEFVAISAEDDSFEKRIDFYEKQMNRMGWVVHEILNENFYNYWGYKYKKKVLIFRREV